MTRLFKYLIIILNVQLLAAQQNNTLYFMHSLPESNWLNPAVQIPCKVFVGLPALTSIHVNIANSAFSYNDVIVPGTADSIQLNPDHMLNSAGKTEYLDAEVNLNLIAFGFLYKKYYFSFMVNDRIEATAGYPGNLFVLALKGNASYTGQRLDLSNFLANALYFREWSIGASKILDDKWQVGVRGKLLFGKANTRTNESTLGLYTGNTIYPLRVDSRIEQDFSPIEVTRNTDGTVRSVSLPGNMDIGSFLLNSENKGLALDLGALYKWDENITLSFSALDLGFINWNTSPVKFTQRTNPIIINYSGFNTDSVNNGFDNTRDMIDSITRGMEFLAAPTSYTTWLYPKIYLGGTYKLLDELNIGLLSKLEFRGYRTIPSLTASANYEMNKNLALTGSLSYLYGSFANLGGGFSIRTPNFGFYAVSDNIYGMFKYKSTRVLNIRLGFNLLFRCKECEESQRKVSNSEGCAYYRDVEAKKERMENKRRQMEKAKKKRK